MICIALQSGYNRVSWPFDCCCAWVADGGLFSLQWPLHNMTLGTLCRELEEQLAQKERDNEELQREFLALRKANLIHTQTIKALGSSKDLYVDMSLCDLCVHPYLFVLCVSISV